MSSDSKKPTADLKVAARQFYESGEYVEARRVYERMLDRNPDDVQTLCNLAKVLVQLGELRSASNAANRVIALDSTHEQAYHIAAKICEKQGDWEKCERLVLQGMEKCEEPYLLEDYYFEVLEMKSERKSQQTTTEESVTDSESKTTSTTNSSKPSPSPSTLPDDCPDLVSDSDSDSDSYSDSGDDVPVKNNVTKPAKAVPQKEKVPEKVPAKVTEKAPEKVPEKVPESFIQQDEFMKTVVSVAKEKNLTYEDVANIRIEKFKNLCKEGSEAYLQGIHRKAIDKYKEAYDLVDDLPLNLFKITDIDYSVLKYMLCLLRIQSANYENLVSAIQVLKELEEKQARTLPSVYYLLGLAYQTLNRQKQAVDIGEKGLSFLEKDIQFESQPYPQVYDIIPETTRKELQLKLEELVNNCRVYRQPDAVCRFSKCLTVTNHILPSCNIYYSDPDFVGYVSAICEEHCKISFHLNCWRSWKDGIADGRKVTDKDVLGLHCFTEDCKTDGELNSKIVQIDIIGTDGQVKSSVKCTAKTDKCAVKNKRNESISSDKQQPENPTKKERKTAPPPVEKPALEPVAKEKAEKLAVVKQKKVIEPVPSVKPKIPKEVMKDDINEDTAKDAPFPLVDLTPRLQKLQKLREMNFGYSENNELNPEKIDYGIEMDSEEPIDFGIATADPECNNTLEFILSMFYSYLKSEGPQKKSDVVRKWEEEKSDLDPHLFVQKNWQGICELLLQSYHFCQIGSFITISKQVHMAYKLLLNDYENCHQRSVSESEESTPDYYSSRSYDSDYVESVKNHRPDTYAPVPVPAAAKPKSATNKITNHTEVKNSNNNNNINNRSRKSSKNFEDNTPNDIDFPPLGKITDKHKTNASAPAPVKNPEVKKIKMAPEPVKEKKNIAAAPEPVKEKKLIVAAPEPVKEEKNIAASPAPTPAPAAKLPEINATKPRPRPGISRSKLSELLSMQFKNEESDDEAQAQGETEFPEINVRKIKTVPKLDKTLDDSEKSNVEKETAPVEEKLNPFMAVIEKKEDDDDDFECINVKSRNALLRSKLELNRNKNGLTSSERRKRVVDYISNFEPGLDEKGDMKVTENESYNFPPAKDFNDLSQDEKVTSTNTHSPVSTQEIDCQTNETEIQDTAVQTTPQEERRPLSTEESDKLLEIYKNEIEEWKEKNQNLELMLVESYSSNAQLTEELEDLKEQFKKVVEEKAVAIKVRNETINELKEELKMSEKFSAPVDKASESVEQLKKALKRSEKDLLELKKMIEVQNKEKEDKVSEQLQTAEEFLVTVLKDYSRILLTNFKERASEKIKVLEKSVGHCTDETSPSRNQILLVQKRWEEARCEVAGKILDFEKKLDEASKKIAKGEKVVKFKKIYVPLYALPTTLKDLFDPVPALLEKLLEDVNKLANIIMQFVPQAHGMNLRNVLVDRTRIQGTSRPPQAPQQIFFPVYQQPAMGPPGHVVPPPQAPAPPFPVHYASGQNLVYQSNVVCDNEGSKSTSTRKSRSPSVSSTKSDCSVQSSSSVMSDCSSSASNLLSKKPDSKKAEESKPINDSKGAKPKNESPKNLPSDTASPSSKTFINSNKNFPPLKSVKLTATNSAKSSLKSTQNNTSAITNKFLAHLKKSFPETSDLELEKCLTAIRKSNSGTLVGLDLETAIKEVAEQLRLRPKNSNSLSYVKYTGPAWGTVKEEKIDWHKTDNAIIDCVICFEKLTKINYIQLPCKHEFHELCIKKWFKEATVCPTCKRRCLLQDEYPPLK